MSESIFGAPVKSFLNPETKKCEFIISTGVHNANCKSAFTSGEPKK